ASSTQTVGVGASDQHGSSAKTQRLYDVAATANTAIEQDFDAIAYACHNFRQHLQTRRDAVELAAAVIGNDQRVCSHVRCAAGVVSRVNAFYHDRSIPCLANPSEIIPSHYGLLKSGSHIGVHHRSLPRNNDVR